MGTTELRKRGTSEKGLTDKEKLFIHHYLISRNGKDSAIKAGYSKKTAHVLASRMLKKKKIKAAIGKQLEEDRKNFQIQRYEILWNLWACINRNGKQFVDDDGNLLINNINDLPDEVTAAIDGIKQREITKTDRYGNTTTEVITEIKLVSKAKCLDMAMQHKGLFEPIKHEHELKRINWDELYNPPDVEEDILEVEVRRLEDKTKRKGKT